MEGALERAAAGRTLREMSELKRRREREKEGKRERESDRERERVER